MVLNPALYAALRKRFGTVKVHTAGTKASWHLERDPGGKFKVKFAKGGGGEQYAVCCPFCGDRKFRLEIGHTWLKIFPRTTEATTHNLKCFNEDCKGVYEESFYRPILDFIHGQGQLHAIMAAAAEVEPAKPKLQMRMPLGCVSLDTLSPGHRALTFLAKKYTGLTPHYLASGYGACFTAELDPQYPLAFERIIFPVYEKGILVGWQGRSVDWNSAKRWLLPPGFQKTFYNADNVGPGQVPIICEGITSSICCGPNGEAIFGKELNDERCREFAARWPTAVIALDPECAIPDPHANGRVFTQELKGRLDQFLKVPSYILQWPAEAMEAAMRKAAYEKTKVQARLAKLPPPPVEEHKVPDAADYGIVAMHAILAQVPPSHRGIA